MGLNICSRKSDRYMLVRLSYVALRYFKSVFSMQDSLLTFDASYKSSVIQDAQHGLNLVVYKSALNR